jgi:NADH dehydrogenase, FAD-containing subunit
MASIVVVGAGLGGMSAAYELRETLGMDHEVTLVGQGGQFGFTPSNPWLAVGWRKPEEITLRVAAYVGKHGIAFNGDGVAHIDAESHVVVTGAGERFPYDYLLAALAPSWPSTRCPAPVLRTATRNPYARRRMRSARGRRIRNF